VDDYFQKLVSNLIGVDILNANMPDRFLVSLVCLEKEFFDEF